MPAETGFRDLFVELPRALFEALQGIGEQAVREATAKRDEQRWHATSPRPSHRALVEFGVRALGYRLGWRDCSVSVSPSECTKVVCVQLACGHVHRFEIDDRRLVAAPNIGHEVVDALLEHADERSCYCTPREG